MWQGVNATSGKYIVIIDGDGQIQVTDIRIAYKSIKHKDFDFVANMIYHLFKFLR